MMTPGDSLISKGWGSGPLPLPPSGSAHVWLTLCHKIKRYLMWCLKVQVIVWLSANYFFSIYTIFTETDNKIDLGLSY